jgi:hypothetical protein
MKKTLRIVGYGIAGLIIAVGLTVGAFAIAGADISQPASPVGPSATPATPSLSPTPSPGDDGRGHDIGDDHGGSGSPSPSIDDHGGSHPSGSGSDDAGSGSDSSGSGSDDHSGSGSGGDD